MRRLPRLRLQRLRRLPRLPLRWMRRWLGSSRLRGRLRRLLRFVGQMPLVLGPIVH
jgi:hypothetical protein